MNGHNRLIRRNHTYYIRARIPVALVYLVHRQEFQYSLQTNNYYEAIVKLSKESHKISSKQGYKTAREAADFMNKACDTMEMPDMRAELMNVPADAYKTLKIVETIYKRK